MGAGARFTFITGGARSGKSGYALKLAMGRPGPWWYLATARPLDAEMQERIRNHKNERGGGWQTIEEPLNPEASIAGLEGVVLIDCLTLWITNLIEAGLDDQAVRGRAMALASACASAGAGVIAVSNEVGMGIVPQNALARRFRDLSGTANQIMAQAAAEVYLVASGLPLKMK